MQLLRMLDILAAYRAAAIPLLRIVGNGRRVPQRHWRGGGGRGGIGSRRIGDHGRKGQTERRRRGGRMHRARGEGRRWVRRREGSCYEARGLDGKGATEGRRLRLRLRCQSLWVGRRRGRRRPGGAVIERRRHGRPWARSLERLQQSAGRILRGQMGPVVDRLQGERDITTASDPRRQRVMQHDGLQSSGPMAAAGGRSTNGPGCSIPAKRAPLVQTAKLACGCGWGLEGCVWRRGIAALPSLSGRLQLPPSREHAPTTRTARHHSLHGNTHTPTSYRRLLARRGRAFHRR